MRQIGLIGGIGPAATDYYYRTIIKTFEAKGEEGTYDPANDCK